MSLIRKVLEFELKEILNKDDENQLRRFEVNGIGLICFDQSSSTSSKFKNGRVLDCLRTITQIQTGSLDKCLIYSFSTILESTFSFKKDDIPAHLIPALLTLQSGGSTHTEYALRKAYEYCRQHPRQEITIFINTDGECTDKNAVKTELSKMVGLTNTKIIITSVVNSTFDLEGDLLNQLSGIAGLDLLHLCIETGIINQVFLFQIYTPNGWMVYHKQVPFIVGKIAFFDNYISVPNDGVFDEVLTEIRVLLNYHIHNLKSMEDITDFFNEVFTMLQHANRNSISLFINIYELMENLFTELLVNNVVMLRLCENMLSSTRCKVESNTFIPRAEFMSLFQVEYSKTSEDLQNDSFSAMQEGSVHFNDIISLLDDDTMQSVFGESFNLLIDGDTYHNACIVKDGRICVGIPFISPFNRTMRYFNHQRIRQYVRLILTGLGFGLKSIEPVIFVIVRMVQICLNDDISEEIKRHWVRLTLIMLSKANKGDPSKTDLTILFEGKFIANVYGAYELYNSFQTSLYMLEMNHIPVICCWYLACVFIETFADDMEDCNIMYHQFENVEDIFEGDSEPTTNQLILLKKHIDIVDEFVDDGKLTSQHFINFFKEKHSEEKKTDDEEEWEDILCVNRLSVLQNSENSYEILSRDIMQTQNDDPEKVHFVAMFSTTMQTSSLSAPPPPPPSQPQNQHHNKTYDANDETKILENESLYSFKHNKTYNDMIPAQRWKLCRWFRREHKYS